MFPTLTRSSSTTSVGDIERSVNRATSTSGIRGTASIPPPWIGTSTTPCGVLKATAPVKAYAASFCVAMTLANPGTEPNRIATGKVIEPDPGTRSGAIAGMANAVATSPCAAGLPSSRRPKRTRETESGKGLGLSTRHWKVMSAWVNLNSSTFAPSNAIFGSATGIGAGGRRPGLLVGAASGDRGEGEGEGELAHGDEYARVVTVRQDAGSQRLVNGRHSEGPERYPLGGERPVPCGVGRPLHRVLGPTPPEARWRSSWR